MNVLIIDTCNSPMYAIALKGDERAVRVSDTASRKYNSLLLRYIDEALNELNIGIRDIDLIACVVGAGSFTGIRLGIATAKALARATGAKTAALNEFEIMAFGTAGKVLAAIDALHGNYYAGEYEEGKEIRLFNAEKADLDNFPGSVIVKDGAFNIESVIGAVKKYLDDEKTELIPLYMKLSQAEREEEAKKRALKNEKQ